eukprot:6851211-Prymnesium_polylepis.1
MADRDSVGVNFTGFIHGNRNIWIQRASQCGRGDSGVLFPLDLPWCRTRPSWSRCGVRAAFDT